MIGDAVLKMSKFSTRKQSVLERHHLGEIVGPDFVAAEGVPDLVSS